MIYSAICIDNKKVYLNHLIILLIVKYPIMIRLKFFRKSIFRRLMGDMQMNTAKTRGASNMDLHLDLHLLLTKIYQSMPIYAKDQNGEKLENTRF